MTHATKSIVRMLNDNDAIVRSTVTENEIAYYAVDDLVNQKTLHIPVSEIDLTFLTADTTNGVQEGNDEDVCTGDPVRQSVFFASLEDLADDECIGSYVTYQMLEKIKSVYGIS